MLKDSLCSSSGGVEMLLYFFGHKTNFISLSEHLKAGCQALKGVSMLCFDLINIE